MSSTLSYQLLFKHPDVSTYQNNKIIGQSPYGDIKAKVEYTTEKITLTLSYKDLAEVLIKSNQPNLATLNLRFIIEIEDDEKPEDPTCIIVTIPEELKYLSASELTSLANQNH